jgi:hypothetical protein
MDSLHSLTDTGNTAIRTGVDAPGLPDAEDLGFATWAGRPFPSRGQRRHIDRRLESGRIDLACGRREEDVSIGRPRQAPVAHDRLRVPLEVFLRPELQRVDEHGHDHEVVARAGCANQRQMAFMERAHCGNHADALAELVPALRPGGHAIRAADNLHGTHEFVQ